MADKNDEVLIHSAEQFSKIIKQRRDNASKHIVNEDMLTDDTPRVEHTECANLTCKIIMMLPIDALIKHIMIERLSYPLIYGKEKTHLSIALENGLTADDVIEMEAYGLQVLEDHLQKVSASDFVQNFNRDKTVEKIVKETQMKMGNSEKSEVQKEE